MNRLHKLTLLTVISILGLSTVETAHASNAIAMVRKEYTTDKYRVLPEFKQDIPGIDTYEKYAQYLPDL